MRTIIFWDIDDVIAIDSNYSGTAVAATLEDDPSSISKEFCQLVFSSSAVENLIDDKTKEHQ